MRFGAVSVGLAVAGGSAYGLLEHGVLPGLTITDAGSVSSPPPFFVTVDGADDIQVQATATGKITDRARPPAVFRDTDTIRPAVLAAPSRSGRFAVAYGGQGAPTRIYTFGLTPIGRVTSLAPLPGGVVPDLVGIRLAVSADGTRSPDRQIARTGPGRGRWSP